VAEPTPFVEALARRLIQECRRDIEAARLQIEAMRAILSGSRWLIARWDKRRRDDAVTGGLRLPVYNAAKASGFIEIQEPTHRRMRRRKRHSQRRAG